MGKLNLLHHKSWHVYNEANRARVRADEEAARLADAKKQEPALHADQEARLTQLRRKAASRRIAEEGSVPSLEPSPATATREEPVHSGHILLFSDAEAASRSIGLQKNPRREAESAAKAKAEADKFTWYLGETLDGKKAKPWYAAADPKAEVRKQPPQGPLGIPTNEKKRKDKDERRKAREDPLAAVRKAEGGKVAKLRRAEINKGSAKRINVIPPSGASAIEKLRAERLSREMAEQMKTRELLQPASNPPTRHEREVSYYNSQFNPGAARRRTSEDRSRQTDERSGANSPHRR
ncbi:Leukocyte receptor cluster member 1 [Geranomyces variabilis]|uniref:Leukocyte receptor cluster member 1 n=1 Tax=Geranomyces variabilis TaxID=109894 RepID=A0AAD5TKY3_9FUNG|nr:Leukocyte receptor cluster member 1 [Geranomyces variabilis]